jgi:hypothetical protein
MCSLLNLVLSFGLYVGHCWALGIQYHYQWTSRTGTRLLVPSIQFDPIVLSTVSGCPKVYMLLYLV